MFLVNECVEPVSVYLRLECELLELDDDITDIGDVIVVLTIKKDPDPMAFQNKRIQKSNLVKLIVNIFSSRIPVHNE